MNLDARSGNMPTEQQQLGIAIQYSEEEKWRKAAIW